MSNIYSIPTEPGISYPRICLGDIRHPVNGVPSLGFKEEDATLKADGTWACVRNGENMRLAFKEGAIIDKYDPATGDKIGTMSHDDVLTAIYSAGRCAQTLRDIAKAAEAVAEAEAAAAAEAKAAAKAAAEAAELEQAASSEG